MLLLYNIIIDVEKAGKGYHPDAYQPHVENTDAGTMIMIVCDMMVRSFLH
jgi:hypothetical protein